MSSPESDRDDRLPMHDRVGIGAASHAIEMFLTCGSCSSLILAAIALFGASISGAVTASGPSERHGLILVGAVASLVSFNIVGGTLQKQSRTPSRWIRAKVILACLFPAAFGSYLLLVEGVWRGYRMAAGPAGSLTWRGVFARIVLVLTGFLIAQAALLLGISVNSGSSLPEAGVT